MRGVVMGWAVMGGVVLGESVKLLLKLGWRLAAAS